MSVPNPDLNRPTREGDGPLASVVLATYQSDPELIEESLESIARQTYGNIELVVVDGGGEPWLRELADQHPWVTYEYQEPRGLPAAWNTGIEVADGAYIGFLADDDYHLPEKTERQVAMLEGGCELVYSDEFVIGPDQQVKYLNALPIEGQETHYIEFFRVGHGVPHLTMMGSRDCFEAEPFDEQLGVREDPHLWVRLFKAFEVCVIDEALAVKREQEGSATGDPDNLYENELREIELLCDQFPELEAYRDERDRMATYRYGKHLYRNGRTTEARSVLLELVQEGMIDHRVIGLIVASLVPVNSEQLLPRIKSLESWLKR